MGISTIFISLAQPLRTGFLILRVFAQTRNRADSPTLNSMDTFVFFEFFRLLGLFNVCCALFPCRPIGIRLILHLLMNLKIPMLLRLAILTWITPTVGLCSSDNALLLSSIWAPTQKHCPLILKISGMAINLPVL